METNDQDKELQEHFQEYNTKRRKWKVMAGILVTAIGGIFLSKQMGLIFLPAWVFTWPMIFIAIGLFSGLKNGFQNMSWLVFLLVGAYFLSERIYPELSIRPYLWPIAIIIIGLFMIFKPRNRRCCGPNQQKRCKNKYYTRSSEWTSHNTKNEYSKDLSGNDQIDTLSIFGGIKKNVISKEFKGGEVTCLFGGAEINLSQADIKETVVLEVTQVFGGTKLIIPTNWKVQMDMTAIFGGIEDKRNLNGNDLTDPNKTLIIKGVSLFAGMEIKSY